MNKWDGLRFPRRTLPSNQGNFCWYCSQLLHCWGKFIVCGYCSAECVWYRGGLGIDGTPARPERTAVNRHVKVPAVVRVAYFFPLLPQSWLKLQQIAFHKFFTLESEYRCGFLLARSPGCNMFLYLSFYKIHKWSWFVRPFYQYAQVFYFHFAQMFDETCRDVTMMSPGAS